MGSNYKKYFLVLATMCVFHFVGLSSSDTHSQGSHEARVKRKRALAQQFRDETGKSPCLSCSQGSDEWDNPIEQQPVMNPFEIECLNERADSGGLESFDQPKAARLAQIVRQWQEGVDSRPVA